MSSYLYIDVELGPTPVTEAFFHKLDAALAAHHFSPASECARAGEKMAYKFKVKSGDPVGFIPWPAYTRSFERDEVLHIRYECGPCPLMQAMIEQAGERVVWGVTCWLFFSQPQMIRRLHFATGPEYGLLHDELGQRCFEQLKEVCDTLHKQFMSVDTALFRENENGEDLPEPQRLLYRVAV